MDLFPKAFVVYIEKNDSLHFNQLSAKLIHTNFKDNKLSSLFATGNVETRYYRRDTITNEVLDMAQSQSGKLLANFDKGQLLNFSLIQSVNHKSTPLDKVKDDEKILKNFLWKPKDRPASKEAILPPSPKTSRPVKLPSAKPPATKKPATKTAAKIKPLQKTAKPDTTQKTKPIQSIKPDTARKADTAKKKD